MPTTKKIFIAYAPEDQALCGELRKQLNALKGPIWDQSKILAGQDVNRETLKELEDAKIILVLLSADFLSSKEKLIMTIIQQKAIIVPILLRPCLWQVTDFKAMQILPRNGKAVTSHTNTDEAFFNIAMEIKAILDSTNTSENEPKASENEELTSQYKDKSGNNYNQKAGRDIINMGNITGDVTFN